MRILSLLIICLSLVSTTALSQITWTIYDTSNSVLPHMIVSNVCEGDGGVIWAATNKGLVKIDGTNWTVYDTSGTGHSLSNLFSMAFDKTNNMLWISNPYNLFRFDGNTWMQWNYSALVGSSISIAIQSDGTVWQTHYNWPGPGGISSFDGNTFTYYNSFNSPLPENMVGHIAVDYNDDLWITTDTSGLVRFSGGTTWTVYDSSNTPVLSNSVRLIAFDTNNQLWVSGYHYPGPQPFLASFDGNTWVAFDTSTCSLGFINTMALTIDQANRKWIGFYYDGLKIIGDTTCLHYNSGNSPIPPYILNDILIASNGEAWIGTYGGGLVRINLPVGIEEYETENKVKVFPNPANESVTLTYQLNGMVCGVMTLFNHVGQEIIKYELESADNMLKFSTRQLVPGVYYVRIQQQTEIIDNLKLVIIR